MIFDNLDIMYEGIYIILFDINVKPCAVIQHIYNFKVIYSKLVNFNIFFSVQLL